MTLLRRTEATTPHEAGNDLATAGPKPGWAIWTARSLSPQGWLDSTRFPQVPKQGRMMSALSRDQIRTMMGDVLEAQGKAIPTNDATQLSEIGFRSLDFSELALRVEDELGSELNFDAPGLRAIETVGDVLEFLEQLQQA